MRGLPVTLLLLGLVPLCRTAAAQWGLAAEIGVARFGGSARDTSGTVVGPYRPTTVGLRVESGAGGVALALTVMYAKTGVAGERDGFAVVQYDAASLWDVAPQVSLRLARFGAGVEARLEGGPAVDVWTVDGESRTRFAAHAGAALQWPLARALTGSLRLTGSLSQSVFDEAEMPAGTERRSTRRLGIALGVRYQP